jgi:hypothetical protein
VREAVLMQRPVVDHMPQSPASRCFRILASRIAGFAPSGPGLRLASDNDPEGEIPGDTTQEPRCA